MPPASNILETVRSTCHAAAAAHEDIVRVSQEAIQALAAQLDSLEVTVTARGAQQMPLNFASADEHATFLALRHLLDFGSGYDAHLTAKPHGRDARELAQYGVLGMYMHVKRLDAAWMASFNQGSVQSLFGLDTHEDVAVPNLPGVTMSRPGILSDFVKDIARCVQEAGAALQEEGAASFGQAILAVVDGLKQHPTPAAALVQELVDNIPGFADQGLVDGQKVVFARKAQALVFSLCSVLGPSDARFAFKDIASLAGDSGAWVAGVLRHKGVLQLQPELAMAVDAGQDIQHGSLPERVLRSATVVALDALAQAMGRAVAPAQLSAYFLYLTEEGQALHGQVKPHRTRNTVAY